MSPFFNYWKSKESTLVVILKFRMWDTRKNEILPPANV